MCKKKTIMIIGATGGIASSCAEELNDSNTDLILVGRNEERLKDLQKKLLLDEDVRIIPDLTNGGIGRTRVSYLTTDMSSSESVKKLFQELKQENIKLDGMVYSVGVEGVMPLKMMKRDYLNDVMDVNCMAFIEMCRYFSSKRISEEGASVVAISSLAGCMNYVGEIAYCISKAALDSAVKGVAKELARRKIRVNSVLPGTTETAMLSKARERVENFDERVLDSQPFGIIDARQIAYLVSFLLSEKSKYITGACIPVCAGNIV